MAELQRKKDILHKLIQARNAVKRKYNLLKYGKENFEKAIGETFKPIVDPLRELVSVSKNRMPNEQINSKVKIPQQDEEYASSEASAQTIRFDQDDALEEEEDISEMPLERADAVDEAASFVKLQRIPSEESQYLDKVYGVRKEGDKYKIGNSQIDFLDKHVRVKDVKYPKTVGLLELLYTKNPEMHLVSSEDKVKYREILEATSAHRKQHKSDQPIRTHTGRKYTDVIAPLFRTTRTSKKGGSLPRYKKGGSLPKYKKARINTRMDYVYWDDPNELVDRLRLLVAERDAGNNSHDNEIRSIIEELREAGYIY